jgi:hypothetical protein
MPLFDGAMEFALAKMAMTHLSQLGSVMVFYVSAELYDMIGGPTFSFLFLGG